jgi:hypothetical protein
MRRKLWILLICLAGGNLAQYLKELDRPILLAELGAALREEAVKAVSPGNSVQRPGCLRGLVPDPRKRM